MTLLQPMRRHLRRSLRTVICVFVLTLATSAAAPQALAGFVFTIIPDGPYLNVVGIGTLNTAALSFQSSNTSMDSIGTYPAHLTVGNGGADLYGPGQTGEINGPYSWGPGMNFLQAYATVSAGSLVGLLQNELFVPSGYVSGAALSDSATFPGTLTSLDLTPGSYTYFWGNGATADTLIVNIVPEPSAWAILLIGLSASGHLHKRRSRSVL